MLQVDGVRQTLPQCANDTLVMHGQRHLFSNFQRPFAFTTTGGALGDPASIQCLAMSCCVMHVTGMTPP